MDLLTADPLAEEHMHKLKKLVQAPNSFFLDVRCSQCENISTIFSHSQTSVQCQHCAQILCTTSGGKAKLSVGSSWRRKGDWVTAAWLCQNEPINAEELSELRTLSCVRSPKMQTKIPSRKMPLLQERTSACWWISVCLSVSKLYPTFVSVFFRYLQLRVSILPIFTPQLNSISSPYNSFIITLYTASLIMSIAQYSILTKS